ncbi:DUF6895 family protein [Streptomyces sp. NPDC048639]|uniref:DUF6895 family protein n=1 Tax=Streptomyces sp. NPDC048639 TaxID=3365581 RepID=UPI003715D0A5
MTTVQPGRRSSQGRAVEERAVAWLAARRALIDPGSAGQDGVLFVRKALIETAFLVGLRARLVPEPLEDDYAALLDQVRDIAERPSYRELIARDETALLLYAGTYAALRLCGHDSPEFLRIVRQAASGGYATAFERVPYRQLDLLHTLLLCGIEDEHGRPSMDDVLPFSLLCSRPNVIKLSDRDVYAITHTVFYVTDFGLREPLWPPGFQPGEAVELVEALLTVSQARENADLVGELLCCLLCFGIRVSEPADRARQFLEAVQEPTGRVNGPSGILPPAFAGKDDQYRAWAEGYHTTIVAALAGLLDRSPRTLVAQRPPIPVRADAEVTEPLRVAVVWLTDHAVRLPVRTGLPAAAAAACGAAALGEPDLARPALRHFARLLAGAEECVWQDHGMEIAGEFARGLRATGISCPSLERFLRATADVVRTLDSVPPEAVGNLHRLAALGLLDARHAADLTADAARESAADPACAVPALMDAVKTYHLGRVAETLREMSGAGWADHRIVRDTTRFLLAQQHADGAFGYPACDDPGERAQARLSWTRSIVTALASVRDPVRTTGDHRAPPAPTAAPASANSGAQKGT